MEERKESSFYEDFDFEYNLINNNLNNKTDDSIISHRSYFCHDCHQFPIIHYLDNLNLEVTCSCYKCKRMTIDEILNPKKNIFNSTIFSSSYSDDNINNELKNCTFHQKQFEYYCFDCEFNFCEDCLENHIFHSIKNITKYIRDNECTIYETLTKLFTLLSNYINESFSSNLSYNSEEEEEEKQALKKDKYIKLF